MPHGEMGPAKSVSAVTISALRRVGLRDGRMSSSISWSESAANEQIRANLHKVQLRPTGRSLG